jgi:hypothetical protein
MNDFSIMDVLHPKQQLGKPIKDLTFTEVLSFLRFDPAS